MFMHEDRIEWEVEDGRFSSDRGSTVSPCSATCEVVKEYHPHAQVSKQVSGVLRFPRGKPDPSMFYDERNVPKKHNAVVENETKELTIEGLLFAPDPPVQPTPADFEKVEFVALDANLTVRDP